MFKYAVLLTFGALAARADHCPVLNSGTVAGILGAPVELHVDGETCIFKSAHATVTLLVSKQNSRKCTERSEPVAAIGNEASVCDEPGGRQLLIGRVRNQRFLIEIDTGAAQPNRAKLRDQLRALAESVAGNLF